MFHVACYVLREKRLQTEFHFGIFCFGCYHFIGCFFHIHVSSDQNVLRFEIIVPSASSVRGTPDPFPNSAVKPHSADGSRKVRVGQC